MSSNPFSLSFGKKPVEYIERFDLKQTVLTDLMSANPTSNVFMFTGVRGSGKTVMLTQISRELATEDDWIVVGLNPTRDMLTSLSAKLYAKQPVYALLENAEIDLSAFGFGLKIKNQPPVVDIETVLEMMFEKLAQAGKRVLITVDDVSNRLTVQQFISAFQMFIRDEAPLYLLMTGLYENVSDLQNSKDLTFLYRAPKYYMTPLNLGAMAHSYQTSLQVTPALAQEMANLTMGYPFAYQVLGYLVFQTQATSIATVLPQFDQIMQELVYEKIWSELSGNDRKVITVIAQGESRVKDIRTKVGFDSSKMSVYRKRLLEKGIVVSNEYGHLILALPRFGEIVR
ncbi:ATP-binding protein [Limosilactobacillus equigenerosi]|uniref:ATPase domain-containing protein n=1 Tax=Limosilactobacillus equigenerosi DSM 18793 = JCM 14505 TaxID=1423742 RepID=A0A0R1UUB0_9LACO|nr:ATP-binding protein [Limosilactobacillus equigenerosi]KRL95059.1 hypothetical protein FC21_GL001106 [Limosilactobacillus equigenerosi DSM 18793 = JCM 14505]